MNVISRGIRNAFRNTIRTFSIIVILGLSIGLSLAMLIAHQTVSDKINSVKSSVGNTITISPAGFNPGSQANNALTTSGLSKVQSINHVAMVTETLTDRLSTTGSSQPSFGFGGGSNSGSSATTSLTSPVKINIDKNRSGSGGGFFVSGGASSLPSNFTPPISFLGTNDPTQVNGSTITIKSGKTIDGNQDSDDALISTSMASKNNLKAGSTFQAYNTTLTVAGTFDSGTQADGDTVILSLPAEQRLSGQSGSVTGAVATVDSLDNLSRTTNAIKKSLGSSADVVSSQQQADDTIKPLQNIQSISLYSLVGAVVAGSIIILLTMVMIVRERRREIGVIKAIGASNLNVMFQFTVEAITLTVLGAVIGIVLGVAAGNPITNTLVTNSSTSSTTSPAGGRGGFDGGFAGGGGGGGRAATIRTGGRGFAAVRDNFSNIHAVVGWSIILYGLAAAVIIAIVGSALASFFIAKIRPAEVMRVE